MLAVPRWRPGQSELRLATSRRSFGAVERARRGGHALWPTHKAWATRARGTRAHLLLGRRFVDWMLESVQERSASRKSRGASESSSRRALGRGGGDASARGVADFSLGRGGASRAEPLPTPPAIEPSPVECRLTPSQALAPFFLSCACPARGPRSSHQCRLTRPAHPCRLRPAAAARPVGPLQVRACPARKPEGPAHSCKPRHGRRAEKPGRLRADPGRDPVARRLSDGQARLRSAGKPGSCMGVGNLLRAVQELALSDSPGTCSNSFGNLPRVIRASSLLRIIRALELNPSRAEGGVIVESLQLSSRASAQLETSGRRPCTVSASDPEGLTVSDSDHDAQARHTEPGF